MNYASARRGFTLVELMITVLIIGILATIAVFMLGNARIKGRDAKRVSDVQVIRTALEHHWLEKATYPAAASWINLGTGTGGALSSNGFEASPGTGNVYLAKVPAGPNTSEYYQYRSASPYNGYSILFVTEGTTVYGSAGTYYAHSLGVDQSSTQN